MKRFYIVLFVFFSLHIFADDMSFTLRYPEDKSGFVVGLMPKNMPDEKGYKGSETTITPLLSGVAYNHNNFIFRLIVPLIINPDETKDDIMLNTVLLDAGYLFGFDNTVLQSGVQFAPALNLGSNPQNEIRNNLSFYVLIFKKIIGDLSAGLNLQYYQSLSDKIKYSGLYITRANSGFSAELKLEYYFEKERLSVLSEILLFRDVSNGISNVYLNPGVRFLIDELNTVYVTLSIPLYDDKFCERYGSGLNLYYAKRF